MLNRFLTTFVPIAFLINFLIGALVGSIAFFIDDKRSINGIQRSYFTTALILSGMVTPLDRLPLQNILVLLPTSYLLHHPMQIYLGKYSTYDILYTYMGGIAWCIGLYFLARLTFQIGLRKNESTGL